MFKNCYYHLLALCLLAYGIRAEVITYAPAPEIPASEWYQIKANGRNVFVYESNVAPFANFDMQGEVLLEVECKREVKWIEIRPQSLNLTYTLTGRNIKIKLNKPCQFSLETNGLPYKEAFLVFANPIEKHKPSRKDTNVIFFESGKFHKAGIINVQSGKTVYIEGGAVVNGLIYAENAKNIKILGHGILDGTGNRGFGEKKWHNFITLKDCKNVTLDGITLIKPETWQIVPLHSSEVLIDNIHIVSDNGGDDGIDVSRTKNIIIQNSFIRTKDDNIVVKCIGKYPDSERTENLLVRNCVLWNTVWGNAIEIGFELATDTVKNLRFENCDIIHCLDGAAFSIHNTDYAIVTDVVFENIRVEETTQKLFDLSIFFSKYSRDNTFSKQETADRYWHGTWDNAIKLNEEEKMTFAAKRGQIKNIVFKNINVTGGPLPFSIINGYDKNHIITGIKFININVLGKKMTSLENGRFYTEYADKIEFE